MICRICGKEYNEERKDWDFEILDHLGGLGVSYEDVCMDCCYSGHSKLAKYAQEIFKENV